MGWIDPSNEIVIGHTVILLSSQKETLGLGQAIYYGGESPMQSSSWQKIPAFELWARAAIGPSHKSSLAELNLKFCEVGACSQRNAWADSRTPFLAAHQGYLRRVQIEIRRSRFGVRGSGVHRPITLQSFSGFLPASFLSLKPISCAGHPTLLSAG